MKKNERLLSLLGEIDEEYIKDAEPASALARHKKKIIAAAASLAVVIALSLTVALIPGNNKSSQEDPKAPFAEGTADYSSLIAVIDKYVSENKKDNWYIGEDGGIFDDEAEGSQSPQGPQEGNGEYIENTDNQVAGVVEADIMKATSKYIFRLGRPNSLTSSRNDYLLRVYSVNKEESALISVFDIPKFEGEKWVSKVEMYLSKDTKTITVIKQFSDENYQSHVGVISIDVSDVNAIKEKSSFSLRGSYNSSRMTEGRLLLFTVSAYSASEVDYSDPQTFVPSYSIGGETKVVSPENVVCPPEVNNLKYMVVTMANEENLEIIDTKSLLNFTFDLYISQNNLFLNREYSVKNEIDGNVVYGKFSDIAIIGYSEDSLEYKGSVTAEGYAKNQYCFDEKDGHLRVVTTTYKSTYWWQPSSASLYVFDLSDNTLRATVPNFAPEGEEVVSARFEGDKLYVCTADVSSYTDPVYFFDLSDYDNITSSDTGFIDGFSTSLIDLGEGYLLGIGLEDRNNNKVEVYKKEDGKVVSVDKYYFGNSTYSEEYKSYLINREENLFGFGLNHFLDQSTGKYEDVFIVLHFDGSKITMVEKVAAQNFSCSTARAVIIDGYLYLTTVTSLAVEKIDVLN